MPDVNSSGISPFVAPKAPHQLQYGSNSFWFLQRARDAQGTAVALAATPPFRHTTHPTELQVCSAKQPFHSTPQALTPPDNSNFWEVETLAPWVSVRLK